MYINYVPVKHLLYVSVVNLLLHITFSYPSVHSSRPF